MESREENNRVLFWVVIGGLVACVAVRAIQYFIF